jgi:replication factor C subunit 3/5
MTSTAQMALRRIMEKFTANTRFCIIANYTHKLSPALLSRCTRFRFSPLKEQDIRRLVDTVIDAEGVKIDPPAVDALVKLSRGDMRRALNVLQSTHASSAPLKVPGEKPVNSEERDLITETTIYDCIAAPHPTDIRTIRDTLLKNTDITSCLQTIAQLKASKGLALADIITAVSEELRKLDVPLATRVTWIEGLSEIEYRLSGGGSEMMQTGALVGVVRNGAELIATRKK